MNALVLATALLFASAEDASSVGSAAAEDPVAKDKPAAKKKIKKKEKIEKSDAKEKKPGATKVEKRRKPAEEAPFGVEANARAGAGASTGRTLHRLPSAISTLGASLKPSLRLGPAEVRADLDLEDEETWGAPLRESSARGSLEAELRPWHELRLVAEAGLAALSRPAWPDPYQPIDLDPSLGLRPTDRGSHVDWWVQGRLLWMPATRHFVRARYRFTRTDSFDDPAFDALARPNHLTPFDNDEHAAELSWRATLGRLRPGVALGASRQDWFFVFSRDAGTGVTHVGEGGAPPNPLLAENALEVEPELELELADDQLEVKLAWRLRLVQDPWQGYQSRTESRLRLDAEWRLGPRDRRLALEGKLDVDLRWYADTGYAAGPDHPPLDWGDRREARGARLSLGGRFPDRQPLRAFFEVEGSAYLTNFPDYVPGVFPASQAYDVKRDWQHGRAVLGVELDLGR